MKKPRAYYNEFDKSAAAWLRELIKEGVITDGTVDERSIEDVVPAELAEFDRCHFFAGVGVWDYALTRGRWPDDRRVWTGSCPCQPFSAAGKGDGFADERHLWPAWFHLIEQCRPRTIFGEQVSSKDTLPWIDLVHADLEGALYTVAAADLCSPSVGAPHIRQRLYFVGELADSKGSRRGILDTSNDRASNAQIDASANADHRFIDGSRPVAESAHELAKPVSIGRRGRSDGDTPGDGGEIQTAGRGGIGQLADALPAGRTERRPESGNRPIAGSGGSGENGRLGNSTSEGLSERSGEPLSREETCPVIERSSENIGIGVALGDTERLGRDSRLDSGEGISDSRNGEEIGQQWEVSRVGAGERGGSPGPTNGFWRNSEWIYCRDGKWRPVGTIESGAFEMADELAADLGCVRDQSSGRYTISPLIEKGKGRVARLRGYGNAIVAEVAVKWIESYLEAQESEL